MNKKLYSRPETETVKMEYEQMLLAGSDPKVSDEGISGDFNGAGEGDPGVMGRAKKNDLWASDGE